MTTAPEPLFVFEQSAAHRAAALLHKLDASRTEHTTRVTCTEPDCRSELLCQERHVDNLKATWRCLEHRQITSTTTKGTP